MAVVSVLSLPVRTGAERAIACAYETARVFELSRESGGFLGGRLLRPERPGGPFLVVAEWETPADYERWLGSSARAGLAEHLAPHLRGDMPAGAIYAVVNT
jgi:heme-degrading monooxygenase HmoA